MPRINVDDSLFSDRRFILFSRTCNSIEEALGYVVMSWKVAQKHYLTKTRMIPIEVWKSQGLNDKLIEFDLAMVTNKDGHDYVRVRGSDDNFSWLSQRSDAGKKSGESRRNTVSKNNRTTVHPRSSPVNETEPLPLPLSLSLIQNTKTKNISSDEIKDAMQEYYATCKYFKATPLSGADHKILTEVSRWGFDNVRLALIGARHEKAFDGFDPSKVFSLTRIFKPDAIEKFAMLGSQQENKSSRSKELDDKHNKMLKDLEGDNS